VQAEKIKINRPKKCGLGDDAEKTATGGAGAQLTPGITSAVVTGQGVAAIPSTKE
jgi:hypothetical protein